MTANRARSTEGKTCEDADDGDDGEKFNEGERVKGTIFVLVERGKSGCSHNYEHNFTREISKGKKQLVYVGGVTGGDFDHWVAGGVRFAGDQRCDSGGKEGRGGGDGGIDQDSGERILCGVFGVSFEHEWQDGSGFFKSD